jgi:hypothetical protein
VLVDLLSQRHAVEKYVESWPPDKVLAWMRQYGTVWEPRADALQLYLFRSWAGLESHFYFKNDHKLCVYDSGFLY